MTKKKTAKRGTSLTEKYEKMAKLFSDSYVDAVEPISDDDVKRAIFPEAKFNIARDANSIVCDSVPSPPSMLDSDFGPAPLGWREVPPSKIPMKGIYGKILKHFAARNFFIGDQVNGWFGQNCFVYKACNMPGEDAVACGYELKPRNGKDKKLVQSLCDRFNSEEFNLDDSMRTFECNKRMYGGAIMVPCFEEAVDMSKPLADYSQFKGKTFIGWSNIEPYYLSPVFGENSRAISDPTYKYYMVPDFWDVYGGADGTYCQRIHRSWIFFRRNVITSRIYQPMYKYLGPSVPQMILERLYSAEVCANESSMLLRSKRTFTMEADIRKMVANPEYAQKFLKNCAANQDNWGIRLVPRGSNAKQMDCLLSECMPLTTAQYGILCAEVEIPSPKFMMAQLTGFANSGNYEIKLYAQNIRKLLKADLEQIVKQTVRFQTACDLGAPVDMDVEFGEVDIPTITEEAEILYEKARAAKFAAEAKAISKGQKPSNDHKTVIEKVDK